MPVTMDITDEQFKAYLVQYVDLDRVVINGVSDRTKHICFPYRERTRNRWSDHVDYTRKPICGCFDPYGQTATEEAINIYDIDKVVKEVTCKVCRTIVAKACHDHKAYRQFGNRRYFWYSKSWLEYKHSPVAQSLGRTAKSRVVDFSNDLNVFASYSGVDSNHIAYIWPCSSERDMEVVGMTFCGLSVRSARLVRADSMLWDMKCKHCLLMAAAFAEKGIRYGDMPAGILYAARESVETIDAVGRCRLPALI